MDLLTTISLLLKGRSLILKGIEDLTEPQLNEIPTGFKNNILWNIGHIIVTQQVLYYTLSRLETKISKELISQFRTGTSPETWKVQPDIDELKELLISLPEKAVTDYNSGLFHEFRPFTTSTGFELKTFEDAVTFNNYHEGVHTGIILSLKKSVTQ